MITVAIINKIRQVIRYFETSKLVGADYGKISIFNDGPGNRKQITYGASQTTEFGNLAALINMYIKANGKHAGDFKTYQGRIGVLNRPTLADVPAFMNLLKTAASDPVMATTQDIFFNLYYMNPARQWFDRQGFTLPLSLLVIYDSYVHSGSMMNFLMNEFPDKKPAAGGNERRWITAYVDARDKWLENNTNRPILQKTDYRTDSFIHAIRNNNWLLDKPFEVVNFKEKDESDKPVVQVSIK